MCVFADHAGLLPTVTPVVRQMLSATSGLVGLDRAVEADNRHPAPAGALPLPDLTGHFRAFGTGLADPAQIRQLAASALTAPQCRSTQATGAFYSDDAAQVASAVAVSLVSGDPVQPIGDPTATTALHDHLTGDPGTARTWMPTYLDAARDCDVPALGRLGQGR